jgi:chromosome segregation ATPase
MSQLPTTAQEESVLHEVRVNAMLKATISQRDASNNQMVKILSDLAVVEARLATAESQAVHFKAQAENLLSSNQVLSTRVLQLEDQTSSLRMEIHTYAQLLEEVKNTDTPATLAIGTDVPATPVSE